ncbi:hypothetical protein [Reichenbachiella sp.]|uniref:hypothetical protein n=1 Tax=Reichenbachiella sp. TaxID=2184521 RepID=UPI003B59AA65
MALTNYQIDFEKLIRDLLEVDRRTPDRIAWLKSILAGVEQTYSTLIAYTNLKRTELSYSPGYKIQVEKLLNDTYGGGIYITNHQQAHAPNFMFDRGNLKNLGMYNRTSVRNRHLPSRGSYDFNLVNFTVHVPSALVFDQDQMRALINKYKRIGLTLDIVTY